MVQCSLQKPKQYLHLKVVSSTAYILVFWSSFLMLPPRSCMHMCRCKWTELRTRYDRHLTQQANRSCIVRTKQNLLVRWRYLAPLKCQYYRTIKTGMTENSLPHLSLCGGLGGLLSTAREHEVLQTSALSNCSWILNLSPCPPGNDTDCIRKTIIWKILFVIYSIITTSRVY